MRRKLRRVLAAIALTLFLGAMFYPFDPSAENGILGPLGQALFVYLIGGWLVILIGVDPTGAGAVFSFFSPWPSLNVLLVAGLIFRPALRYWKWLGAFVVGLAVFSPVVALRLADPVSAIPLVFWSSACIVAAIAIRIKIPRQPTESLS